MKKRILSLILSFVIVFTMLIPFATITMSVKTEAVSYTADPNWYSADKSILEINDIPDFIAFMNKMNELGTTDNGSALNVAGNLAGISWTGKMPFEGQTIVLNTDIVLNSGIMFGTNGPSASSAYTFKRTSTQVGFGGIFDGRGHTISGLYIISNKGGSGSLFGVGGAATKRMNVVVRNLQIKNSLIENSAMGVASIFSGVAFNSHVLIENVYSEAILKSTAATVSTDSKLKTSIIGVNMGGFCGTVGGNLSIINSIYAGTFVTDTSKTPKKYVGGMVGNITNKTINSVGYSGNLTVENSAYYGTFNGSGVYIGKLSGDQTAGSTVVVNNSIFGGTMKSTASFTPGSGASTGASTYYIGRLIGLCTSNYTIKVTNTVMTSTYKNTTAVTANYNSLSTANSGSAVSVSIVIDDNLKGEKETLKEPMHLNWVPNGTMNGYPVPVSYPTLFGVESLKHNYVTELPLTASDLFEQLGVKRENTGIYTEGSYRRYSEAYDDIVGMIFATDADLTKIDVPTLKANAEALLKTPADEKREELIILLGEKIENTDNYYTASSYEAYSSAYEQIVNSLNSATTVDALNNIDVATLRANAEAKLVLSSDNLREELIGLLGEKIANTDNYYTASSYDAYSSAYDAILKSLNDAASVDALNKIDVIALKSAAEAKLKTSADELRSELKSILGEKLTNTNGQYTNDSYSAYSSAYEQIVNSLNSATTVDALNNIDVATLRANAEAKLITLADKLRNELKSVLGEKISNAENHYTTESYAEYSSAYDAIIRTLDSVTTVDALNNINVATLKLNAEAKLVMTVSRLRDVLKAALGEKISNANNYYANDSFIEYSKAYDAIVKSIDDATTFEELNAIDVESLKAEAEAKLVTLADKLRGELIGLLGDKKANIDDYFTAESYEAYSSAFDTIITKLNEVTTVEALEKIDVLALKKDAEALLVKYIPDLETEPATEPATEPETEPESEPENESETDILIEDNGCGGCDSSAAISAIATVAIVGVALTMKKRKD